MPGSAASVCSDSSQAEFSAARSRFVAADLHGSTHLTNPELARIWDGCGIAVQAWSPLGEGAMLRDRVIRAVADDIDRSPAQIVLRWDPQRGHIVLPKASSPERITQNAALHDVILTTEQMARLDQDETGRTGPDPESM